jgi:dipeptide/tripeptide permease
MAILHLFHRSQVTGVVVVKTSVLLVVSVLYEGKASTVLGRRGAWLTIGRVGVLFCGNPDIENKQKESFASLFYIFFFSLLFFCLSLVTHRGGPRE